MGVQRRVHRLTLQPRRTDRAGVDGLPQIVDRLVVFSQAEMNRSGCLWRDHPLLLALKLLQDLPGLPGTSGFRNRVTELTE